MTPWEHGIYAFLWLGFGLGHSLLAGRTGRRALEPVVGRYHRAAYNLVALVHLALVVGGGRLMLAADVERFVRPCPLALVQTLAIGLALALFWAGSRRYDMGRFLGTRPEVLGSAPEPLVTDGVHAHLRHPLYAGGYLLLFGFATDVFAVATAAWASLYLAVGTWIEERRLVAAYGDGYRRYRRAVPALWPRLRPYRPR